MTEYKRARTHTYLELQAMQSKQRKHDDASERLFKKAKAKANMNILGAHIRLIYAYLYHGNTVFIKLLSFNVYIKIIVQHTQFFYSSSKYTATRTHQYCERWYGRNVRQAANELLIHVYV